jgi:hypothetical protein
LAFPQLSLTQNETLSDEAFEIILALCCFPELIVLVDENSVGESRTTHQIQITHAEQAEPDDIAVVGRSLEQSTLLTDELVGVADQRQSIVGRRLTFVLRRSLRLG